MLDSLRNDYWVPRSVRNKQHLLEKTKATLHGEGKEGSSEDIRTSLGLSEEEFFSIEQDAAPPTVLSLEDITSSLGEAEIMLNNLPDARILKAENKQMLSNLINELEERKRTVLSLYYVEGLKLKEIGDILGVTESRVCQLHKKAIEELRTLVGDTVDDFI